MNAEKAGEKEEKIIFLNRDKDWDQSSLVLYHHSSTEDCLQIKDKEGKVLLDIKKDGDVYLEGKLVGKSPKASEVLININKAK